MASLIFIVANLPYGTFVDANFYMLKFEPFCPRPLESLLSSLGSFKSTETPGQLFMVLSWGTKNYILFSWPYKMGNRTLVTIISHVIAILKQEPVHLFWFC